MKPIALFQHHPDDGAGYFLDFARRAHLPIVLFRGDLGEALPTTIQPFSALVSLGGPMSVNDRLDFIEYEALLMEEAIEHHIPILGHCLGSQLLARTLGAEIQANAPAPVEIGWHRVAATDDQHPDWTDLFRLGEVFQWHNESWRLPQGAELLLGNAHCPHQMFRHGVHLGMQFHIEITAGKIQSWCRSSSHEPAKWSHLPCAQSAEAMQQDLAERVALSNRMADGIYQRWSQALHQKG